jgi:hypothetical protein
MRFCVEHRFPASPAAVAALMVDADFVAGVALPDLARPEIVAREEHGSEVTLRVRYEFVGRLDPVAQRLVGRRRLTWLQDVTVDVALGRGRIDFTIEAEPDKVRGAATVTLDDAGAGATRRIVEGELVVRVPLIGRAAERAIVPGLVRRLELEAAALQQACVESPE